MNLWSFQFADPAHPLQSARVAAPNKADAVIEMDAFLTAAGHPAMPLPHQARPADRVILTWIGLTDAATPFVVSLIKRDGTEIVNLGVA